MDEVSDVGEASVERKAVRREDRVMVTGYSFRILVGMHWFSAKL